MREIGGGDSGDGRAQHPVGRGVAQGCGIVEFERPEEAAYAINNLHLTQVRVFCSLKPDPNREHELA